MGLERVAHDEDISMLGLQLQWMRTIRMEWLYRRYDSASFSFLSSTYLDRFGTWTPLQLASRLDMPHPPLLVEPHHSSTSPPLQLSNSGVLNRASTTMPTGTRTGRRSCLGLEFVALTQQAKGRKFILHLMHLGLTVRMLVGGHTAKIMVRVSGAFRMHGMLPHMHRLDHGSRKLLEETIRRGDRSG